MIDTRAPNDTIPFVAYGLIGLTSLVLAYATLMDIQTKKEGDGDGESATSMLPPVSTEPEVTSTEPGSLLPASAAPVAGVPIVPVSPIVPPPLEQLNNINPEKTQEAPVLPQVVPQALPVAEKVGGKSKKSKNIKKHTRKHK